MYTQDCMICRPRYLWLQLTAETYRASNHITQLSQKWGLTDLSIGKIVWVNISVWYDIHIWTHKLTYRYTFRTFQDLQKLNWGRKRLAHSSWGYRMEVYPHLTSTLHWCLTVLRNTVSMWLGWWRCSSMQSRYAPTRQLLRRWQF